MILQIGALASTFCFSESNARVLFIYIFAVIEPLSQQLFNIIALLSSFHSISVNRINHPFQLSLPLDSKPVRGAPARIFQVCSSERLGGSCSCSGNRDQRCRCNTVAHRLDMARQHVEASVQPLACGGGGTSTQRCSRPRLRSEVSRRMYVALRRIVFRA
jgi:hypothetical protein